MEEEGRGKRGGKEEKGIESKRVEQVPSKKGRGRRQKGEGDGNRRGEGIGGKKGTGGREGTGM